MREIKFRAWSELDKEMFEVASIDLLLGIIVRQCENRIKTYVLEELVLMQYTGLKDKHGVEIYEGDIVRGRIYHMFYEDNVVFQIGWIDEENGYGLHWFPKEVEVIGNIFENPELMA